jgi:hypothetical protein
LIESRGKDAGRESIGTDVTWCPAYAATASAQQDHHAQTQRVGIVTTRSRRIANIIHRSRATLTSFLDMSDTWSFGGMIHVGQKAGLVFVTETPRQNKER